MEVSNHALKRSVVIKWIGVSSPQNSLSIIVSTLSPVIPKCSAISWNVKHPYFFLLLSDLGDSVSFPTAAVSVNTCGIFSRCLYIIIHFATLPFLSFSTRTPLDGCRQHGAVIHILSFFLPWVNSGLQTWIIIPFKNYCNDKDLTGL